MSVLMRCENPFRLKSFDTPDVFANERVNIRMARLVFRQLLLHFERFFALLVRLSVNVVAYKVKDALV